MEPAYQAIRARAIEIQSPEVRSLVDTIAGVMHMHGLARATFVDWQVGELAHKIRAAGRGVLGAHLRGEPIPPQTELVELDRAIDDYTESVEQVPRGRT